MGTGYTRNDISNNIADGNIISATDLDGEYDAIEAAFATSGHTHNGSAGEGGPITLVGPVQDLVISATEVRPKTTNTLDVGTASLLFKDAFFDGVLTTGTIKIDNGGTIGSASDSDAITISSGGVVTLSQNTIGKTATGYTFQLQTSDTTVESGNTIGKITFNAPDEASGTDAILVGAEIEAAAEATFDSATNSTALIFKTNTSAAATERMRIKSDGDIVFNGASYDMTWDTSANALSFADNAKAVFGAGSDLQIYHDGTHSYVSDQGTGNIKILADDFVLKNAADTETMIQAFTDAAVSLWYDNAQKLATTATGVDVTGTLVSDGLTVDSSSGITINGPASADGKLNLVAYAGVQDAEARIQAARGNTSGTDSRLQFLTNNGTSLLTRVDINDNGDISFYEDTGTTPKLFWDASAERLGIGNAAPASALDVTGTVTADGLTVEQNVGSKITFSSTDVAIAGGEIIGEIDFYSSDASGIGAASRANISAVAADAAGAGDVYIKTSTGGAAVANRLKVANNGDISFYEDTGTTPKFFWDASAESLGIGTTSPSAPIDVRGSGGALPTTNSVDIAYFSKSGSAGIQVISGTTGAAFIGFGDTDSRSRGAVVYDNSADSLYFTSAATERLRIDSSGNVGIGTSSPDVNLHVAGSNGYIKTERTGGSPSAMILGSESGTNVFYSQDGSSGASPLRFVTGTTESMRLDASGNLLVGTTDTSPHNNSGVTSGGIALHSDSYLSVGRASGAAMFINRQQNDGDIIEFRKDGSTVGSIGNTGTNLFIACNNGAGLNLRTAVITPANATGDRLDASIDLGDSNYRFKDLYLSGGVYLGGTGAANKLDDYEEGTWTPVLTTDNADMIIATTNFAFGKYTKIGRFVQLVLNYGVTTFTSVGTGNLKITGFPFNPASDGSYPFYGGPVIASDGFSTNPTTFGLFGTGNTLRFMNGTTTMAASDLDGGVLWVRGTFTYQTT